MGLKSNIRVPWMAGVLAIMTPVGLGSAQEVSDAVETANPPLQPPRLLESPPPRYPEEHVGEGLHPTVVLQVTLNRLGGVEGAEVEHGAEVRHQADPAFNEAAVAAVRRWKFAPATRDGVAIASRIRVAVHFSLPGFDLIPTLPEVQGTGQPWVTESSHLRDSLEMGEPAHVHTGKDEGHPHWLHHTFGARAQVEADALREPHRAAGDVVVGREVLAAAPRREGAEVLSSAPGVFMARGEGDAVGHRIMLRGFDAEHGQDLELKVGGLPINLPSHIHGQGYADLGLVIGEVVDELQVKEGVYDPIQGDFAVAGSVNMKLGVADRGHGWRLKSGVGSFGATRQFALWAPPDESEETFGAVQYQRTDGFGRRRRGQSASGIVQAGFGEGAWRYRLLGMVYGARADLAGVVRRDDVAAGSVGFYDAYDFSTAQQQNGSTSRVMAGFMGEYRGPDGDSGDFGVWLSRDDFRLQENFTGFVQRSQTLDDVAGRGDLIEQLNATTTLGLWGRYQTLDYHLDSWFVGALEFGMSGRMDVVEQAQNLIDATTRSQTWDRRVDAGIRATDIGFWTEAVVSIHSRLDVRGGLRADALSFAVEDRLGNFVPTVRPDDAFIEGFRRSAAGLAWGPRFSTAYLLGDGVRMMAAYGEGYRSPQARTLEDGEDAPFTKVRSSDVGLRWEPERAFGRDKALELNASLYWTHVSDDVAFEAREGRLERLGASRRMGATLFARANPWEGVVGAVSVTYVDASLLEPPPATPDNPTPAFEKGQNLPLVPPLVVRADVGAHQTLWSKHPGVGPTDGETPFDVLDGHVGTGFSFLSSRPLPYGAFADPVSLLDLSAGLDWGPFHLTLEVFNVLNARYAAVEYNFASNWDPSAVPTRTPARHIAAGAPRTWMAVLEVSL